MVEQVEVRERSRPGKLKISVWACVLIVAVITILAFLCFGGAHYIQNQHEIDARYWRRASDLQNWMQWAFYLTDIGAVAGLLGLIGSTAVITAINWPRRPKSK